MMQPQQIGVVAAINRYPVKSMRAETLARGDLHWIGLHGDRQYAYLRQTSRTRFPWLTGRDVPALVLHTARYADPDDPRNAPLTVTTPEGVTYAADDPALIARLSDAAGEPVSLLQVGRGCFDAMPVSVIATATEVALDAARGAALGLARFRANIVIRTAPDSGREVSWLGGSLRFGAGTDAPRLAMDWAIPRCAMVTIDPDSAERDASVMRLVAQEFRNEIGAYGTPEVLGPIEVGDPVWLLPRG
jgi:uncharacterized protein YcbX